MWWFDILVLVPMSCCLPRRFTVSFFLLKAGVSGYALQPNSIVPLWLHLRHLLYLMDAMRRKATNIGISMPGRLEQIGRDSLSRQKYFEHLAQCPACLLCFCNSDFIESKESFSKGTTNSHRLDFKGSYRNPANGYIHYAAQSFCEGTSSRVLAP